MSLERQVRHLQTEKKKLENEVDQARQIGKDQIAITDHDRIIATIRLEFANRLV